MKENWDSLAQPGRSILSSGWALFLMLVALAGCAIPGASIQRSPSTQLVTMFSVPYNDLPPWAKQGAWEDPYAAVSAELLRRRDTGFLIDAYVRTSNETTRHYLVLTLCQIDDPAVLRAFQGWLSESESEANYRIADYAARRGDRIALAQLNRHYFMYPVSSVQWASTVELFGRFGHRQAIPNLVNSLDAASLNLAEAALHALRLLYPDAPKIFTTSQDAQQYFRARFEAESRGVSFPVERGQG